MRLVLVVIIVGLIIVIGAASYVAVQPHCPVPINNDGLPKWNGDDIRITGACVNDVCYHIDECGNVNRV